MTLQALLDTFQECLSPDQVSRMTAAARTIRDLLVVLLPSRTGMSSSELIAIEIQDVDFRNRVLLVRGRVIKSNGVVVEKQRIVPLDLNTVRSINKYLEWRKQFSYTGELLFPISRQRLHQIYHTLAARAGIRKNEDIHHLLRNFFITQSIRGNMDIETLSKILGYIPRGTSLTNFPVAELRCQYDKVWDLPD
jgi:integrase/recombinase XerD